MTPVEFGDVDRSMNAINIGNVRGMSSRRLQRELEGLREWEDQFVIEVAGRGEEFPVWGEVHLKFNIDFVDATGQRDTPFDRPHFTYGVVIPSGGPIGLDACVTRWDIDDRNQTVGCMLSIGARATDFARNFRGELHARFQGYGAPTEAYGDPTQYDRG